jgi:hypothetical protein
MSHWSKVYETLYIYKLCVKYSLRIRIYNHGDSKKTLRLNLTNVMLPECVLVEVMHKTDQQIA